MSRFHQPTISETGRHPNNRIALIDTDEFGYGLPDIGPDPEGPFVRHSRLPRKNGCFKHNVIGVWSGFDAAVVAQTMNGQFKTTDGVLNHALIVENQPDLCNEIVTLCVRQEKSAIDIKFHSGFELLCPVKPDTCTDKAGQRDQLVD